MTHYHSVAAACPAPVTEEFHPLLKLAEFGFDLAILGAVIVGGYLLWKKVIQPDLAKLVNSHAATVASATISAAASNVATAAASVAKAV